MKEAKEITPVTTGVITAQELLKYISKAKLDSIAKHPLFKQTMHAAQGANIPIGYRYKLDRNGFETVDVAHGPMGDGDKALRRMLSFQIRYKGRSISQVDLYHNWNNERHSQGGIRWEYVKTV